MISLIVAASQNGGIGKNNQLLWHLPNDLKFFKNKTWGLPVIMGRKTFEAVGKPLPGRKNIVITRQPNWESPGVERAADLAEALRLAHATHAKEIMVIGGGEVYRESFPQASTIYLTRVQEVIEADTFFPELEPAEWKLTEQQDFPADEKHAYPYSFQTWKRN